MRRLAWHVDKRCDDSEKLRQYALFYSPHVIARIENLSIRYTDMK